MGDLSHLTNEQLSQIAAQSAPAPSGGSDLSHLSNDELAAIAGGSNKDAQRAFDTMPNSNAEEKGKGLLSILQRIRSGKPNTDDPGEIAANYAYKNPGETGAAIATVGAPELAVPGRIALTAIRTAGLAGAGAAAATGAKDLSEGKSVSEAADNALTEGGKQAAIYGTGEAALQKGVPIAEKALKNLAETSAFKAAGAMLKDFRSAYSQNPQKINELGRTMLDNGLVQAGDSVSSIAKKAEVLKRQTGQEIGDVYNKTLDALTDSAKTAHVSPELRMEIDASGFHPEAQADEMKQAVYNALKGKPGSTQAISKANEVIDELAVNGNHLTPDHALELKGQVDALINWSKKRSDMPLDQEGLLHIRNYINDKIINQVETLDKVMDTPQTKELLRLNKLYGNVSTISNVARDRTLRNAANQSFTLGDKVLAGGGLAGGLATGHSLEGIAAGAAAGAANHVATKYGAAMTSSLADTAASGLANGVADTPVSQLLSQELARAREEHQSQ